MSGVTDGLAPVLGPVLPFKGDGPSFGETLDAARTNYRALYLSTGQNRYRGAMGGDVVKALAAKGITGFTGADGRKIKYGADALRSDYALNPTVAPRLWADVAAERARDPSFLKDTPDAARFETAVLAQRAADFESSSEVMAEAGLVGGLIPGLAGGLIEMAQDPLQVGIALATLPLGGPVYQALGARLGIGASSSLAKRLLLTAVSDAALNVAATAPTLPVTASAAEDIGVEYGAAEMATELGFAGVFGATIGVSAKVAGPAASAVAAAPARALGAAVDSRVTSRALLRSIGAIKRPLSLAERDAVTVLQAEAETLRTSPFVPDAAGDAMHIDRLETTARALDDDAPIVLPPALDAEQLAARSAAAAERARAQAAADDAEAAQRAVTEAARAPYIAAARRYAMDRSAGPLTPEALGQALGLPPGEANDILRSLSARREGAGLLIQGKNGFRRVPQRRGPVDLITALADAGGLLPKGTRAVGTAGHDLRGTLGDQFVPRAGPLIRPRGRFTLAEAGEWMLDNGYVLASETGNGAPTEAEVLEILSRARTIKHFKMEDASDAAEMLERQRTKALPEAPEGDALRAAILDDEDAVTTAMAGLTAAVDREFMGAADPTLAREIFEDDPVRAASDPEAAFEDWLAREADGLRAESAAYDEVFDDIPFDIGGDDAGPTPNAGAAAGRDGADRGQPVAAAGAARPSEAAGASVRTAGEGASREIETATARAAAADAMRRFDEPDGAGALEQLQSLEHDARAEIAAARGEALPPEMMEADMADTGLFGQVDAFAVDERGAQSLTDIMAQFDADEAAAKAVRDCL